MSSSVNSTTIHSLENAADTPEKSNSTVLRILKSEAEILSELYLAFIGEPCAFTILKVSGEEYRTNEDTLKNYLPINEKWIEEIMESWPTLANARRTLGSGVIVRPFYTRYRHMKLKPEEITNNTNKIILAACKRIQGRIIIFGICASPLLMATSIYVNGYNTEKLANRCYEIRCNEEILTYDRYSCAFGLMGWYWKRFQGAVDGINIAFFYTIFYLKFAKYYMNPFEINVLKMKKEEAYPSIEEGELESESLLKFAKKNIYKTEKMK